LTVIGLDVSELVEIEWFFRRVNLSIDRFTLRERARFDLEAHDAHALRVLQRLGLDDDVPVVVEGVLSARKRFAQRDTILIIALDRTIRFACDDS